MRRSAAFLLLLLLMTASLPGVGADGVPGPPMNLRAEREGARIFISWDPPEGDFEVLRYNVYRGLDPDGLTFYDSLDGNFTAGYDTAVVRDRTYYYAVSANTTAGEGERSGVVMVGPPGNGFPVAVMGVLLAAALATVILSYRKGREGGPGP